MAIVLVEQYFDFAFDLGHMFTVMERGSVKFQKNANGLGRKELYSRVLA